MVCISSTVPARRGKSARAHVPTKASALARRLRRRGSRGFRLLQRLLQWTKPRLEIAPLPNSVTVDRLSHLLPPGRGDSPAGLPEPQAALLEAQSAILQHAADFVFRVLDQAFVGEKMNVPGHHRLIVSHHAGVLRITVGKIAESVRKLRVSLEL